MNKDKYQLLKLTADGLYCPQADVYIDPWRRVDKAIVTHAHSDHARWGHQWYLAHKDSEHVLKLRLGPINLQTVEYGETLEMNGVKISLHPAGHAIGSAQVRLEYQGEVWVVSGDYKIEPDNITVPFEPVKCNVFITEATFALPVFNWRPQAEIFDDMNKWWSENQKIGRTSMISCYSFGKAQRLVANINPEIGPIYAHGAIVATNEALTKSGYKFPKVRKIEEAGDDISTALVLTTSPSQLTDMPIRLSVAQASGWMQLRKMRKLGNLDKGFIISDHADWQGLNSAIKATEAELVYVTHGFSEPFARWLTDQGIEAYPLTTEFVGETELPMSENKFAD